MKHHDFTYINLGIESSPSMSKHIQEGMYERFAKLIAPNANTGDIIILSGCQWTVSGSNYSMTAGVVLYNGEMYDVDAFTGVSSGGTIGIYKEVVTTYSGSKAFFGDAEFRDVLGNKKISVVMGLTGTGIADYNGTNVHLSTQKKVLDIGDWNLSGGGVKILAHGLGTNWRKIQRVSGWIRNDANTSNHPLYVRDGSGGVNLTIAYDVTNIYIYQSNTDFQNANYDSTSYNRGKVFIEYGDL